MFYQPTPYRWFGNTDNKPPFGGSGGKCGESGEGVEGEGNGRSE